MRFQDIVFQYVRHGNDYVWAFDIDSRYHGYTRNKLNDFHVYDEVTQAYTSYETKAAFESWLALKDQTNNQNQGNNNNGTNIIQWTGLPETRVEGVSFNVTPLIILGSLGLIYWLYTRS